MKIASTTIQHDICQFIRRPGKNGTVLIGAFTAKKLDNQVFIGWAKCNKRDKFDKKTAIALANKRIETRDRKNRDIPFSIQEDYNAFKARTERYYNPQSKQSKIPTTHGG